MPAEALPTGVLRWMILGEWRAHPARVALGALAIAVGVALGFAVHLINTSALSEFSRAIAAVNGDADLQVRAVSARGFDEQLYPRVARLAGVAAVSPVVELTADLGGGPGDRLTLIGLDVLRAAAATPSLVGRGPAEVRFDEGSLFLSDAALRAGGHRVGDTVEVAAGGRPQPFRIVGDLPAAPDGQRIGVIDIAAAQWRFDRVGRLNRLDLKLAEGADPGAVRAAVSALLPPDAEIASPDSEVRQTDNLSRAYRVNLDMLALVALLTGAFLIYSAQSLSVARRRPQFALLQVLGADRRTILIQVLLESVAVGLLGAGLGLAIGLGLAQAALSLFGGDLGGGFFGNVRRPALTFSPGAAAVFGGLGLASALLGGLAPARQAVGAPPAVALKNLGDAVDPRRTPPLVPALGLLVAGALCALLPPVGGLPLFGYVSIALILGGGIAGVPWLARALLSPAQRLAPGAPSLRLALNRLWGAPSQAAVALCGIVASTSLMIAMAVMVTSFRSSVDDWLLQVFPADIYLTYRGDGDGFDEPVRRAMTAAPGVAGIAFLRTTSLRLSAERPPPALVARPDPGGSLPLVGGRASGPPPGLTPVWLSEPAARIYGHRPGDRLLLPLVDPATDKATTAFVMGVWRDYARQQGSIVLEQADYVRLTGDRLVNEAAVDLDPGAAPGAVVARLRAALPERLAGRTLITESRALRALSLRIFDRSFAITYLLEAIAILVGLAGVTATMSAQTLARIKEFGMLRHVGVLRRQIAAMLAAEGALLGAVGGVAGIGLGLAMSQVLIHVVNPQSFHWTMETHLPLSLFAGVAGALIGVSAIAALMTGRRAISQAAVDAVREDW